VKAERKKGQGQKIRGLEGERVSEEKMG